ncbi:MAG TPA: SH3 domain-containing protein [Chthoniobacterales bacterium]|nr:SH3 domain-containing protein [Chthoniobacterales bacterium]
MKVAQGECGKITRIQIGNVMHYMIQPPSLHLSSRGTIKYTAFALVVLFGTCLGAYGQDRQKNYTVVGVAENDTLNVRSRPDENSAIVTKLRNGYGGIAISGEVVWNGSDDWVPILFSKVKGWVRPKYLSRRDDALALDADVEVGRASMAGADEHLSDERPAKKNTLQSASNNNDAFWLGIFALLAGAIIMDEFSGGDSVSRAGYSPAEAEYDRQKYQRRENEIATSRGGPLPYPNAPH